MTMLSIKSEETCIYKKRSIMRNILALCPDFTGEIVILAFLNICIYLFQYF